MTTRIFNSTSILESINRPGRLSLETMSNTLPGIWLVLGSPLLRLPPLLLPVEQVLRHAARLVGRRRRHRLRIRRGLGALAPEICSHNQSLSGMKQFNYINV